MDTTNPVAGKQSLLSIGSCTGHVETFDYWEKIVIESLPDRLAGTSS